MPQHTRMRLVSGKIPCSVVIPTKDSAKELPILLESVQDFSDIAICDGWSTDDTREVAKRYGARVEMQDKQFLREDGTIKDFSGVRNQCTNIAREQWVLNIDTGDYLKEDFKDKMRQLIASRSVGAYWLNRIYVVRGVEIDCASTYPSRQVRLYHKDAIKSWIKPIHERVEMKPGMEAKIFPANLYTPLPDDVEDLKQKWRGYIELETARRTDFTLRMWLKLAWREILIAGLFTLRLIRNRLTCRGTRLPLAHELSRQWYQAMLIKKLFGRIRKF